MFNVQSPRTDDVGIEQLIQAKNKTAPRITLNDIEANIISEHYFTAKAGAASGDEDNVNIWHDAEDYGKEKIPLSLLTFCVLVLCNGFTVTGESACVSPENYDVDIGHKVARQNAVNKIWPLMGYALKEKLDA